MMDKWPWKEWSRKHTHGKAKLPTSGSEHQSDEPQTLFCRGHGDLFVPGKLRPKKNLPLSGTAFSFFFFDRHYGLTFHTLMLPQLPLASPLSKEHEWVCFRQARERERLTKNIIEPEPFIRCCYTISRFDYALFEISLCFLQRSCCFITTLFDVIWAAEVSASWYARYAWYNLD